MNINQLTAFFLLVLLAGKNIIACPPKRASSCKDQGITGHQHFQLLHAAYEDWAAGIEEGGRGREYYFTIKISSSSKLRFDSLWVDGHAFPISVTKTRGPISNAPVTWKKGDTIILRASHMQQAGINTKRISPPYKFKAAALIRYYVNGKKRYLTINKIQKLQTPNRQ
jgi:hypothetical protein